MNGIEDPNKVLTGGESAAPSSPVAPVAPVAPATPQAYQDNQLEQSLGVQAPSVPPNYGDFLKATSGVTPVNFNGDVGLQDQHLKKVFDGKGTASEAVARISGEGRSDPEMLYQNAIAKNPILADPNLTAEARGIFMEILARNPNANQKVQEEQARQQEAQRMGIGPASVDARGKLTPEGQVQFNQMRDNELLNKLFPDQMAAINGQRDMSARGLPQEGGDALNDSVRSTMLSTIEYRLQNGLIDALTAKTAIDEISKDSRSQYTTTNSVSGKIVAQALGLPDRTAPGSYGRDGGDRYRVSDMLPAADEASRKDVAARTKVATDAADQTIQQNAADQNAVKFNQDQQDRNFKPRPMAVTLSDGRKADFVETSPGKFVQPPSEKADEKDTRAGGKLYDNPVGWEYKGLDGKLTVYDRQSWSQGSDGKLYGLRLKDSASGKESKDRTLADFEFAFPSGVTEYVSPAKQAEQLLKSPGVLNPGDRSAVEWARKNPDDPRAQTIINGIKSRK